MLDIDALRMAVDDCNKHKNEMKGIYLTAEEASDILALLKEQEVKEQCLKKKCVICPHCENCDVDENGLLKEQEAVAPEVEELNEVDRLYRCPKCHKQFFYEKQKYCDQCGQAIKWD